MQKYIIFLCFIFTYIHAKELRGIKKMVEVDEIINLEDIGDIMNNTTIFDQFIKYFFRYDMPSIISYNDNEAECFYIGDRCIFELDGKDILMEIDFDENKPEYTLVVTHNDKKRKIQKSRCEYFNKDIQILKKSIECKITEYAHVIKIKNI